MGWFFLGAVHQLQVPEPWVGLILISSIFGTLTFVIVYEFVRDWRSFLSFNDDLIVQQEIFRQFECRCSEVVEVDWSGGQGVTLCTPTQKCTISFRSYEAEDTQLIVRTLHYRMPTTIQQNWADFCALALRHDKPSKSLGPPPEGYVLATRRRMDRLYLSGIIMVMVMGVAVGSFTRNWWGLLFVPLFGILWLVSRKLRPVAGTYERSAMATSGERNFLLSLPIAMILAIPGILVVHSLTKNPLRQWLSLGIVVAGCGIVALGARGLKRRPAVMTIEPSEAIARWEALNPPLS